MIKKYSPFVGNYKSIWLLAFAFAGTLLSGNQVLAQQPTLEINELEYFEKTGLNVFVFSNQYNGFFFDEKTAGIELIHHGVRTSTGGAVRLQNTPEQWDLVPAVTDRKVDAKNNSIEVTLRYESLDFDSRVKVTSKGNGVDISVYLDEPLPAILQGNAGFNMEFLPSAYFEKTYMMDGYPGNFPDYPFGYTRVEADDKKIPQFAGHNTFDDRGRNEFIIPEPLATGNQFVLAPQDPERRVIINSKDAELMFFDGRSLAQNGWFIVRSLLPANKTGKVLTWHLEANTIPKWKREPNVGFSQVGYTPDQDKVAVIELDVNDKPEKKASLYQVTPEGKFVEKLKGDVNVWGKYLRYNYAKFDFSSVKEPGVYYIKYGDVETNPFRISEDVYDEVWHPTLDVWFPVQMDHMKVNEAYRTWHGASYKDDALQAPTNVVHFDGYEMGDTTDTKYKPLEHIPGLAVGGWYDAGDFDIQTGSHNSVISNFVSTWEDFKVERDQTYIDQNFQYVDIHRPDGVPDLLQQIEHGTLNLVAQVENIGHPIRGIIVPNLHQYHHLGDALTETDGYIYDPELDPYEVEGNRSGTPDDRWAFTTRSPYLDYQTAASLAEASRALKGYNDDLANRSLKHAIRLMEEADAALAKLKNEDDSEERRWFGNADLETALQLYITTNEEKYASRFLELIWTSLEAPTDAGGFGQVFVASRSLNPALRALPYMDADYKSKLKDHIVKYKEYLTGLEEENPYGVPISGGGWGGSGQVVNAAITNYLAYKAFPDVMSKEDVLKGAHYIFGRHPHSNVSFVMAVGTKTKKVAYGNNRADFATIAGGIVPGIIILSPDYPENKDDWPFLWGENEATIGGSAEYIYLGNAINDLISE